MGLIRLDGHDIFYELSGQGEHTLLLLNGITMATASWALLMPILENRYRVLRLDFLGQGQSAKPHTALHTMEEQADIVVRLLDRLGLSRVHLLGLSYGGMVAQHVVHKHADRVDCLVLASTLAWSDAVNAAMCDSWIEANRVGGIDLRYTISIPWLFSSRYLSQHGDHLPELKRLAAMVDWDAVIRLIEGIKRHDARTWLGNVNLPTLILLGSEDRLTPRYQTDILASLIPRARLEILPGAGHVLHLEAAGAMANAIIAFCPY
ncbi:alpha/beta fold hydrolase [Paludibacterium yongneupense]|uniref:alpha/beta fold hydrolase n=1 Tax=Paludibacterium yongneupense TaxID=400061 RepID=UPI0004080C7E|nr:alpha/beta fold hydrolase [Paludibacterium yongneupense]